MTNTLLNTQIVQECLDRAAAGDQAARDALLRHACERLTKLTRSLLRGFPQVRRWEQTDDVFQSAVIRLCRALEETRPTEAKHFYRLAALQIRRELIDLTRRYQGPHGMAAHHASQRADAAGVESAPGAPQEGIDTTHDPQRMAEWGEFHRTVAALPEEEREVFDLLWYQGLSQEEAAHVLQVSVRTIKRRWQTARLSMHAKLGRNFQ